MRMQSLKSIYCINLFLFLLLPPFPLHHFSLLAYFKRIIDSGLHSINKNFEIIHFKIYLTTIIICIIAVPPYYYYPLIASIMFLSFIYFVFYFLVERKAAAAAVRRLRTPLIDCERGHMRDINHL